MFEPDDLLLVLTNAQIDFIVIDGLAVGVHGFVHATKNLNIVPRTTGEFKALDPENHPKRSVAPTRTTARTTRLRGASSSTAATFTPGAGSGSL
jgi:hypothetical protein